MGKNMNGSTTCSTTDSLGVCEKLFTAFTCNPAFQTIRRLSPPGRDTSAMANVSYAPAAGKKTIDIQSKPQELNKPVNRVIQVPIKFEKTESLPASSTPNEKRGKIEAAAPLELARKKVIDIEHITYGIQGKKEKAEQQVKVKNEGKKLHGEVDMNEKFSQYITQARMKIRSKSSMKMQESDHEGNDGKDIHFANFIDRAKRKFKSSSTSNVGGNGKSGVSFKRDQFD